LRRNSLSTSGTGIRDDSALSTGRYAKRDKSVPQQFKAAFQFWFNDRAHS
jgi:hypothetical protein